MIAIVMFAMGFPAAEVLLQSWGTISLITVRIVLACAFLVPIWLLIDGWRIMRATPWLRGLGIGGIGFGTGTIALLVTQSMTDAVTAILVAAMMPVAAVALEVLLDGRRLTVSFLLGVALVLIGGVIAAGGSLSEGQFGLGALIGISATFVFAWGSRATVKDLPEMTNIGQATVTLIGAMLFCVAALVLFLAFGWSGTHVGDLGAQSLGLLVIYALVSMSISQAFWILGVSKVGVGVASFHLNAGPFYVMLILLAFGQSWDWGQALGAAILAVGVVMAQRGDAWADVVAAE